MRSVGRLVVLSVVVAVTVVFLVPAVSAQVGPAYRAGEVVVAGTPDQFPDYNVVKFLPNAKLTVLSVESGKEWGHIQKFLAHGKRAGLNLIAEAVSTPNDPYYSPYQWNLTAIQGEAAWNVTTGTGVVVAVLDTGLRTGGDDGINCVTKPIDIVNGDNDPVDGDGHGTHVSGTIAQKTNNGVACAGMAYGACIMPVKVLDDSGSGSFADIAEGIYYAVTNGAKVINMSLGIAARYNVTNDPVMDPALDAAYAAGVTVVCASGNDGSRKNVGYPAIYPTCIAVGATRYDNTRASYSNAGKGLDIMAPGGDTTVDQNGDGYGDGILQETYYSGAWGYYFFEGTSMASPHVAAVAALVIAKGVATTPDQVRNALTSTAKDLGAAGFDSLYGYGLVQAYAALNSGGGCTDCDNDGYTVPADCNDNNPAVNPGAAELCGDGIDNNCSNGIDEGCSSTCFPAGTTCSSNAECCSGTCHPKKHTCNK